MLCVAIPRCDDRPQLLQLALWVMKHRFIKKNKWILNKSVQMQILENANATISQSAVHPEQQASKQGEFID